MIENQFVRVVIRDANSRILVVVHKGANSLNLPGGKVNPGETPEQAVHRELLEETGMALTATTFVNDGLYCIDGIEWKGYFFKGESNSFMPRNMEPDKHSFVGFCDLEIVKQRGHTAFVAQPIQLATRLAGW